jgi:rhodanese-related sulfurtransferase
VEQEQVLADISAYSASSASTSSIGPQELGRLFLEENICVVDVRSRTEYSRGHIPGARNIPFDEITIRAAHELPRSSLVVFYCDCSGDAKSKAAGDLIRPKGFSRVSVLKGGIAAWLEAGYALDRTSD